MNGMIAPDILEADERFYFDADAADKPVRFIEKVCKPYQGKHAGQPFVLHELQRRMVRDLYG